jgi:hypothetical protein
MSAASWKSRASLTPEGKGAFCSFVLRPDRRINPKVRKFQESGLTIEQVLSMSEDKLQDIYTAFLVRLMFVFPAICPREVETRLFYKDKLEFRQLCSVFY